MMKGTELKCLLKIHCFTFCFGRTSCPKMSPLCTNTAAGSSASFDGVYINDFQQKPKQVCMDTSANHFSS